MPVTNFHDYAQTIEAVLNKTVASGEATLVNIQFDHRSSLRGFIAGLLHFFGGSELHFQDIVNNLIFRYDNAPHRPSLSQAEHKHTPTGIEISPVPTLAQVIDEILRSNQRQ
ncbi:MAG TPA: DUF6516 family protein [Anaerolineae bacterium]